MRLIQLQGTDKRAVGIVDDRRLHLLDKCQSIFALAQFALSAEIPLVEAAELRRGTASLDYEEIYRGESVWRVLPAIDHPFDAARCLVSGTGLSHIRSASNRNAMHTAGEHVTDSMRMYQWGVEGGKPLTGRPGAAPEWFFKGNGHILRAHNEALPVPPFADDGGEEPEIAGIYIVDDAGAPRRIGMCAGNEFSDHVLEKKNYLYLAASKLRHCAIGPELVVDPDFSRVPGRVTIERHGDPVWSREIATGESVMCHSLANLEHHHFKFDQHRHPGDVHVHFFGADAFSFGEGVKLKDGDVMQVSFEGFGRPLRNLVAIAQQEHEMVVVRGV
jgi:hypothetical protein